MKKSARLPALLLLLAAFALAPAQEEPKTRPEKSEKQDKKPAPEFKEPVLSVAEHEVTVGGKVIKYRASAGVR